MKLDIAPRDKDTKLTPPTTLLSGEPSCPRRPMKPLSKGAAFASILLLALGLSGCNSETTVVPDTNKADISIHDVHPTGDADAQADVAEPNDADSNVDSAPLEDTAVLVDTSGLEDSIEPEDTSEPDIAVEPEVEEEDLSGVKLTWKKDIEPISMNKCDNCHGKNGSHGLKLYTKQKWIDYFPMIIPALQKGIMPQGTSLAPGQLEDIILWGKVGYP